MLALCKSWWDAVVRNLLGKGRTISMIFLGIHELSSSFWGPQGGLTVIA